MFQDSHKVVARMNQTIIARFNMKARCDRSELTIDFGCMVQKGKPGLFLDIYGKMGKLERRQITAYPVDELILKLLRAKKERWACHVVAGKLLMDCRLTLADPGILWKFVCGQPKPLCPFGFPSSFSTPEKPVARVDTRNWSRAEVFLRHGWLVCQTTHASDGTRVFHFFLPKPGDGEVS